MTTILYTYNIQIHNKAAIFLINIDTLFYIIESRPTFEIRWMDSIIIRYIFAF